MNADNNQAALYFNADDYAMDTQTLMGRHSASNSLLQAAIAANAGGELLCWANNEPAARAFAGIVNASGRGVTPGWVNPLRPDALARLGALYIPGPNMGQFAQIRLRHGPAKWSITGVTHTTASLGVMDEICALYTNPVCPWDALICTSDAVLQTVRALLDRQGDYLRWRFGAQVALPALPQMPVIPLGVHADAFTVSPAERQAARASLGLAPDAVCVLFNGRLSFHAKAHPHAMYVALAQVAKATRRKIALLQCGWFANDAIESGFTTGAARFAPGVTALWADGRKPDQRKRAMAAADIFISLSDNIQETFGLTPLEAMSAGLPTVVSDWNGYKDTVLHGQTGFRIPTWMPPAPLGEPLARAHADGQINYDRYIFGSALTVSVDQAALIAALQALVENPDLRARMGAAGQAYARQDYDWAMIYRRYQALWAELAAIRAHAGATDTGPRDMPARSDPYALFAHYPTALISPATLVALGPNAAAPLGPLRDHILFSTARDQLPGDALTRPVLQALAGGAMSIAALATTVGVGEAPLTLAVAWLAKTGHLQLSGPA